MTDASHRLPHTRKISRLPALPEKVDPIIEQRFAEQRQRGAEPLNLHLVQAHAPKLAKSRGDFAWTLRNDTKLGRRLLELTILRTARIIDCAYELDHHVPLGLQAGLSAAQIDATQNWRAHASLFDERERALLAYLDQLCDRGNVDDATHAAAAAHFTAQEIVELCYCATSYYANGMFVRAMRIEIDAAHVKAAPGKF